METFGSRSLGKILGIITLIDSLGAAAGTVLTGQLKTSTGDYLLPFGLLTAVALVAVINVLLIRPVKRRASRRHLPQHGLRRTRGCGQYAPHT